MNVSKFHFFCDQKLDEMHSLSAKKALSFVKALKIGPSGVIQKFLDIEVHLKFLMYKHEETERQEEINTKCLATMKKLSTLRKSFRTEKTRLEREQLEDLAGNPQDMTPVTDFLDSAEVSRSFARAIEVLQHPSRHEKMVLTQNYYRALAILAGRLMYR